ncbi:MAG: FHA domain-containing protein [Lachnospiraceae bacterium]|nr:FHA domain-containing protein [Lachnospiraceae bacterium]
MGVFYVSGEGSLIIGRDPGCDCVIDESYVSRRHLRIDPVTCDAAEVCIPGINGAVIGGRTVKKGFRGYIRAGDTVAIGKHLIVWTGKRKGFAEFVHGLSVRRPPEGESVEIEGPPQRKIPEKPSIALAAGPALTMAIPIMLGAGREVAVLSSLFAALWASINVISRIRRNRAEETRRRNTYLSYLQDMENIIQRKSEEARRQLLDAFPYAGAYFKDGGDPFLLWPQTFEERDTLFVRLGTGVTANPVDIIIPKERFAGVDDSLRALPALVKEKYAHISGAPVLSDLKCGAIHGIVLENAKDTEVFASLVLQIAADHTPDSLRMVVNVREDLIRRFIWVVWLPFYVKDADDDFPGITVAVTDDISAACRFAKLKYVVILIKDRKGSFPAGSMQLYPKIGCAYDTVPEALCYSYAATLSRLWQNAGKNSRIPDTVPFKDLFDTLFVTDDTDEMTKQLTDIIIRNHAGCDITASFSAPIGMAEDGRTIFLDLHEKAAGPHGLVAGTTGSGKSELLTTMILSFAMHYPPDKLAFFLIDYKGGGMSGLFRNLPHLLGSISNLSPNESMRAMKALKSENIRRQTIFSKAGVNNINDYTKLYDDGLVSEPLPHILIIIDEFAQMRTEEPEFMDGLISISQIGRSLGMHLILATQKPAGVIDDKIRGNTRFRIALRLVDRSDSMDMLQRGDATQLTGCGRAYLQVGADEIFECFQSAYAMGEVSDAGDGPKIYTDILCTREVTPERNIRESEDELTETKETQTWYELTMKALIAADRTENKPKPACLWLPAVPPDIYDEESFAVFDVPDRQKYEYVSYDPAALGHILIIGKSGSGKSELVKTLLARSKRECFTYIIDHGGGRLKDEAGSSRCGGYIGEDQDDDILRMTAFISGQLTERRRHGLQNMKDTYPTVLVLDNFREVTASSDQEAHEHIRRILMLGRSADIYVLATSLTPPEPKDMKLFDTYLFLGNEDPYTTASSFGVFARDIPVVSEYPGRGVGLLDGRPYEFQSIRLKKPFERPPDIRAPGYPHVPASPELEDLLKRALEEIPVKSFTAKRSDDLMLPIGYIQKSGKIYTLPLGCINCILIGGNAYSGRQLLFNISIIAAGYGIKCVQAKTHATLLSICRNSTDFKIVMIGSIQDFLKEFYDTPENIDKEEELTKIFENPTDERYFGLQGQVVIGVIENETKNSFAGRRIFDSMTRHPYGILIGESPEENRIFDFSYLPFSQFQKSQTRGNATIARYDENRYFGDVILPSLFNVDNSQSL